MSLTPLERDLLACVERLVSACETSAKELSGLEKRSTNMIEKRLVGVTDCMNLLSQSQSSLIIALHGLFAEGTNYDAMDKQLQESLRLAKSAEEKLKQN